MKRIIQALGNTAYGIFLIAAGLFMYFIGFGVYAGLNWKLKIVAIVAALAYGRHIHKRREAEKPKYNTLAEKAKARTQYDDLDRGF